MLYLSPDGEHLAVYEKDLERIAMLTAVRIESVNQFDNDTRTYGKKKFPLMRNKLMTDRERFAKSILEAVEFLAGGSWSLELTSDLVLLVAYKIKALRSVSRTIHGQRFENAVAVADEVLSGAENAYIYNRERFNLYGTLHNGAKIKSDDGEVYDARTLYYVFCPYRWTGEDKWNPLIQSRVAMVAIR